MGFDAYSPALSPSLAFHECTIALKLLFFQSSSLLSVCLSGRWGRDGTLSCVRLSKWAGMGCEIVTKYITYGYRGGGRFHIFSPPSLAGKRLACQFFVIKLRYFQYNIPVFLCK